MAVRIHGGIHVACVACAAGYLNIAVSVLIVVMIIEISSSVGVHVTVVVAAVVVVVVITAVINVLAVLPDAYKRCCY